MVYQPELDQQINHEWENTTPDNCRRTYIMYVDPIYQRRQYSDEEKDILRPVAETIAMLSGYSYTGASTNYELFLPEAMSLLCDGSAIISEVSWTKINHENKSVEEAYNNWKTLRALSKE